ncbi:Tn3 family transposase [Nostoc sp. NIES-2111]
MTLIDRTAYPRFKQYPSAKELTELYTPTLEELKFVKSRVRSHEGLLCFMVMLKSFQRLGYFPHPENVPITINAITNIVEKYHHFLDWVFFGKDGVITENDPIEQEKRLKYLDLVASAVILQNTVDMSLAIQTLTAQGYPVRDFEPHRCGFDL